MFILLTVLYNELLIHFWITSSPNPGKVLALIVSLIPHGKAAKWTAVGFAVILAVIYMTEYFVNDSYQCFMTIPAILNGAGGVATDFFSLALDLVVQEMWRIVLVLLPIAAFAIWARPVTVSWRLRGILAGAAVGVYLIGFGTVHFITGDDAMLSETYHFDSALRNFGVNMAVTLDVVNGGGEKEEEADFELEVLPEPTFETKPTETPSGSTEETAPVEEVYGDNVLPIDFAKAAEECRYSNIIKLHKYVATVEPSKQNAYTGLFKGKNLIIITAESFAAEVIDPELTPTLYRMANEGIKFTDYYQPLWGGSSRIRAISTI